MTENEEIEAEQPTDNSREGKKAAAALDSVTDHHEEKEFSGGASLESILKKSTTASDNGPAIKITAKDIDVIMKAVECKKNDAYKALVAAQGDLSTALKSFLN
ncbi:Oidioi.mRNA.OKI2018_I69.PAR.g11430.t1.cds [Oikopleura dioica]|uniref:Oidioi.mRNA.OKI2018_I69.PAR.g11430.t1.cds n=1 Tax=Oikopleura dioica TaxID=34765 RepID=A0ABN7RZP8_OIKDI|nr:Oidioi.mRNA.OKI2018_I69.PAR.g11430.t1.cds [Oikopleura dioica]